ncbi:MAG TPA: UDP-2,3-diacylglucosamine diphosphatase LpxI [Bradyrhizobium sp.]|uniref:LpxI family protein n=1 Tax=Bradyrhizobium sp. TaxID=376 RepID=UPI002D801BF4|nr:UDP-2,3-diacylglucosamine diphosphatase LpxI [Bradyrhizobium sp.]HET7886600.1 UDP-2,3-diacylglucosamine diphosphatase LpxI [Bradyrhizobium sp.]
MTAAALEISSPVGVIAGGGAMPFAVAESLKARGLEPILFALKGVCDPAAAQRFRHHWIMVGQYGRAKKLFRQENCKNLVFIGTLVRPSLSEIRLDWSTLRIMGRVWSAYRGGDDHLLSGVGRIFEQDGFRLLGLKEAAPDLLMPEGCVTRKMPDQNATSDIARGRAVLQALGPYDVGQAAVVIDGHIVGVEGIEGTDELLMRIADLRARGRIRAPVGHGVLVKAPKSGQDLRFDLPTVGSRTAKGAIAAGLAGIAVIAGSTLVADPQGLIETADASGLFVTGLPS